MAGTWFCVLPIRRSFSSSHSSSTHAALKKNDVEAFDKVRRLIESVPAKYDTEKEAALRVLKQLQRGTKKMYRDYLVLKPAFKVSADGKFRLLKRLNESINCVCDDDEGDETFSRYNMMKLYKIGEDVENVVDILQDVLVPTAEQRAAAKGVLVPSPLRKEELVDASSKPAEAVAAAATVVSASSEVVIEKKPEKTEKEKAAKKLRKDAKKDLQSDDEDDDDEDEEGENEDEIGWYDIMDEVRDAVGRIAKKHSKSMRFIAALIEKKKSSEAKDDAMGGDE